MRSRLALAVVSALVMLLLAEGAVSLLGGRSLLRPGSRSTRVLSLGAPLPVVTDEQRLAESELSEGPWRIPPDPLVSYVVKPGTSQQPGVPPFVVDRMGLRGAPGTLLPEEGLRVFVLGDSVAFGQGVADDETLGAHLQRLLRAIQPADEAPLMVLTAAASGWTHTNAVRFLIDYAEALQPDIVIYLPIGNDVADAYGLTAAGFRRTAPDVTQTDPLLNVASETPMIVAEHLAQLYRSGAAPGLPPEQLGSIALSSDLGPESRRRYDANVDSIERLQRACERLDARLLVAFHEVEGVEPLYGYALRERMLERGLDLDIVELYEQLPDEHRLPTDRHPSTVGHRIMAGWLAEDLLRRGWLAAAPGAVLEAHPPGSEAYRALPRSAADVRARSQALHEELRGYLRSRVDLRTGEGALQIYGGLDTQGCMGARLMATVLAKGRRVRVVLADADGPAHVLPLRVDVAVDGVPLGSITVRSASEQSSVTGEFTLPEPPAPGEAIDVHLAAHDWFASRTDGRSRIVSCRPLLIESY